MSVLGQLIPSLFKGDLPVRERSSGCLALSRAHRYSCRSPGLPGILGREHSVRAPPPPIAVTPHRCQNRSPAEAAIPYWGVDRSAVLQDKNEGGGVSQIVCAGARDGTASILWSPIAVLACFWRHLGSWAQNRCGSFFVSLTSQNSGAEF